MLEWIREFLVMFLDYAKPWTVVNQYEEAVILRGGQYLKTLLPGYYLKWPLLDYYLMVHVKPDTFEFEPISITTLDGKTIIIGLVVEFEVFDSRLYITETNDTPSNMRDIARGEMSDFLEDISWGDIKKKTTKNALRKLLASKYEKMGVRVTDMKFTNKCEGRPYRLFSDKGNIVNAI